jgi:multiple sugar transport system ATP-binding protein
VRSNGIDLPQPEGITVKLDQKVAYGIRPEHLKPSINGAGVIAKVATVHPTGPQTHIDADLAGEEVCAITQDRLAFTTGADIRLLPDLDRLQLLDQESGKAIHG